MTGETAFLVHSENVSLCILYPQESDYGIWLTTFLLIDHKKSFLFPFILPVHGDSKRFFSQWDTVKAYPWPMTLLPSLFCSWLPRVRKLYKFHLILSLHLISKCFSTKFNFIGFFLSWDWSKFTRTLTYLFGEGNHKHLSQFSIGSNYSVSEKSWTSKRFWEKNIHEDCFSKMTYILDFRIWSYIEIQ